MTAVFETLLRMSLTGSLVILVVLLARLALMRAPKKFSYALWAVVLFRLLCPVSFTVSMPLGVWVDTARAAQYLHLEQAQKESTPVRSQTPQTHADAAQAVQEQAASVDAAQAMPSARPVPAAPDAPHPQPKAQTPPVAVLSGVWLAGVAALALSSTVSLLRLRRRLRTARQLRENLYLTAGIQTPFVLGVLRPRVYLPDSLDGQEAAYIILHEQHHIRRGDHVVKLLAFAALTLHWFNPFVWLAFALAGRDMEMSCDEAVMRRTDGEIRADYAQSLLNLSAGHRRFAATPLAFGEGAPRARIKNVLRWKKPAAIVAAVAAVAVVVLTVLLAANQKQAQPQPLAGGRYTVTQCLYQSPSISMWYTPEGAPGYMVTADMQLFQGGDSAYEKRADGTMERGVGNGWNIVGALREASYTRQALSQLFSPGEAYSFVTDEMNALLDEVTKIWSVSGLGDDQFYLLMQTKTGQTLLAGCYEGESGAYAKWLWQLSRSGDAFDIETLQALSREMSGDEKLLLFSFYEIGDTLLAGYESGSNMGFSTFEKKAGGYKLRAVRNFGKAFLYSMTIAQERGLDHSVTVALSRRRDLAKVSARAGDRYQECGVSSCPAMVVFEWPDILPEQTPVEVRFYNAGDKELSRDDTPTEEAAFAASPDPDAMAECLREWSGVSTLSINGMGIHRLNSEQELYTLGYYEQTQQGLALGAAVLRRSGGGAYEVVAGQSLTGASLQTVQFGEIEGLDHSVTVALIGRDDVAMVEARAGEAYLSQQTAYHGTPETYPCPTSLTFEWEQPLPADEQVTVTFYNDAGRTLADGWSTTQEELDFLNQFPQLDSNSLRSYLDAHPALLEGGWENLYLNKAGFDDEGTGVYTIQGDEVLAIDAKNGVLLLRVTGEGYRGVLAIANDPARLSVQMSEGIGQYGQTIGEIAEAHGGVLAMVANGFIDTDAQGNQGNGNGGIIAGYAMSSGQSYGNHFGWGYKRIELHEDNLFYIKDASDPVSEDCTDATEFQPALIIDGEAYYDGFWIEKNPRACIGQTQTGQVLMLVIEGRLLDEGIFGTDVNTCSEILMRYGCTQAMNVDGGTSAMLWFDGAYVTRCSNTRLPDGRPLPNAFVYQRKE